MNPTEAIISALTRDKGGISIIWSPTDISIREWLINEVRSLAEPATDPIQVATVEEALAEPDRLVLLVPELAEEANVVEDLDGSRDQIFSPPRTQPIVLFLYRNTSGQKALATAYSLSSITRGSEPDPELLAQIDPEEERRCFQQKTGKTYDVWLIEWRESHLPKTAENYVLAYEAMLLEQQ